MVQRSQRLLPGVGAPGDRPGHGLRPAAAGRRRTACLLLHRRRGRGRRGAGRGLRAPPRRSPRARRGAPRLRSRAHFAARASPPVSAPTDSELIDALTAQGGGRRITELDRRPYSYATSAPLEELSVRYADGGEGELILKDLARERLLGDAWTKPEFLHDPAREVDAYRRILGPAGIGPRCAAAVAEADPPRHWIALEKVAGVELWQVGELEVWERVARWLGEFHARFADRV